MFLFILQYKDIIYLNKNIYLNKKIDEKFIH